MTEIEILDGGNKIIGKNRGTISTTNGINIEADEFEFDKIKNILDKIEVSKSYDNSVMDKLTTEFG